MNANRKDLILQATKKALDIRSRARIAKTSPLNIYEFCESQGVAVIFQDIPSMEGIYLPDASPRPVVVLSSLRPTGRKAMTCGHEFGHHVFKHGHQWDELMDDRDGSRKFCPEEFLVDAFSSALLMPKSAVIAACRQRELDTKQCSPVDVFKLSLYFGTSYSGFIHHLCQTLGIFTSTQADTLLSYSPKQIRAEIIGRDCPEDLWLADFHWTERAVDVEVGDTILLPDGTNTEGEAIEVASCIRTGLATTASKPGLARVEHQNGWSAYVRVSRRDYVGQARFRFEEETECEEG
jgi:Zn-dependent peptidase ImmA (M78 family)